MERVGSRASVMYGLAKMTGGGLTKDDLMYNEKGKIVSKKKSMMARKNMRGGSRFVPRAKRNKKIEEERTEEKKRTKKFINNYLKNLEIEKLNTQFKTKKKLFNSTKKRRAKLINRLKFMRNKKNKKIEYLHSNSYIHTKIDTNDIKSLINVKIFNNDWLSMIHDSDIFFVDKFIDKLKKIIY